MTSTEERKIEKNKNGNIYNLRSTDILNKFQEIQKLPTYILLNLILIGQGNLLRAFQKPILNISNQNYNLFTGNPYVAICTNQKDGQTNGQS